MTINGLHAHDATTNPGGRNTEPGPDATHGSDDFHVATRPAEPARTGNRYQSGRATVCAVIYDLEYIWKLGETTCHLFLRHYPV